MGLALELLAQARLLATKEPRRPKQSSLRRAVSVSYYALFHLLVEAASRRMVPGRDRVALFMRGGRSQATGSPRAPKLRALRHCLSRAFDHASMQKVARQFASQNVSPKLHSGLNGQPLQPELIAVAEAFGDLQQHRHHADYDMAHRFTRPEAMSITRDAETAFSDWDAVRNSVQADTFLVGLLAFDKMRG